jgi:AraC-like DNA-binding protein
MLRRKFSGSPLEPITTLASTPVDNELLSKLQALIEENFSNPALNVDFIADHLGISRSGLYSKIRTLANVTPNELIQITRLKKAAELLAEGKYRVNEICYMVGFNSNSYFSRCFQKQFGEKPGEFAARHQ